MSRGSVTSWVRSLRGAKDAVDPFRPIGWRWEPERNRDGEIESVLTVYLTGAECRFSCVFCDLWRYTLDQPTPPGGLPAQLELVLAAAGPLPPVRAIKLYNASNFFDERAVPAEDYPAIARLIEPFARVVVESHPRLLGRPCLEFADLIAGRLEVALGLEIADTGLLRRLNKGMTLEQFDQAVGFLSRAGIDVRVFVLLAPPFVPAEDAVDWAVRSVAYAVERGAAHVSLIATRDGSGALEALRRSAEFVPPTLSQAERALETALNGGPAVVTLDLWDAERLAACPGCSPGRLERLGRINLSGRLEPREPCEQCGWR